MSSKHVVVLGAGVSGLSTATLLLKQEKEIKVHLVAKHFPGDSSGEYTSPWAAANWKSHAMNDDIRQQEFDRESYNNFWELAKTSPNETGLMITDEFEYWDKLPQGFTDPWFKTLCHEYRNLRKEELPDGVEFGITYKTISINSTTYLNYLFNTFTLLGGTTQRLDSYLSHINGCIKSETDVVINCSGYHSRTLGGVEDSDVYAARGQIVILQLPPPNIMNYAFFRRARVSSEKLTYAIPRDNGEVILGGTYDENNYSTDADSNTADEIIERCIATRPDILQYGQISQMIKGHGVGIRPCRKGGVRIEAEWTTSENGKKVLICHNYGHGGAGFESSYGTAKHAIKVMKEALNNKG